MKRYIYALSMAVLMGLGFGCAEKKNDNNPPPPPPVMCMPGTGLANVPCQPYNPNGGGCQPNTGINGVPCQPIYGSIPTQGIHYQGYVSVSDRRLVEQALNCRQYVTPWGGSYNACSFYGINTSNLVVDITLNGNGGGTGSVRSTSVAPYSTIGASTGGGTIANIGNGAGIELDTRAGMTANTLGFVIPTYTAGAQSVSVNLTFNNAQFATGTLTLRPY